MIIIDKYDHIFHDWLIDTIQWFINMMVRLISACFTVVKCISDQNNPLVGQVIPHPFLPNPNRQHIYIYTHAGFHKWGMPKMVGLQWKILLKWMTEGYPHLGNLRITMFHIFRKFHTIHVWKWPMENFYTPSCSHCNPTRKAGFIRPTLSCVIHMSNKAKLLGSKCCVDKPVNLNAYPLVI